MRFRSKTAVAIIFFTAAVFALPVSCGDWPMWGRDKTRSHVTPVGLPGELDLHWVRSLPPPRRAWHPQMDDFEKLDFDLSYEPVVAGEAVYVSSMVTDSVTAYSVDTGLELWRYVTGGPVRMAPAVRQGRVYAVSDDGRLYCLDAATGELAWKFLASPSGRTVLGNGRLVSMWPARGGPVIHDGIVYFAAGIWPHEGVFVYALNAENGEIIWANSSSSCDIFLDSKRYYSFGGVAPQGQLVISGDYLLVPGGRTPPAVFNRRTGEFLYLRMATHSTGKGSGGHRVFARGGWFFNVRDRTVTHAYDLADGAQYSRVNVSLAADEAFFGIDARNGLLLAYAPGFFPSGESAPPPEPVGQEFFLRRGRLDADRRAPGVSGRFERNALRQFYSLRSIRAEPAPFLRRLHIKAGSVLYGSGTGGRIYAIDVSNIQDIQAPPRVAWEKTVSGEVFSMAAARGRLFVVTEEGRLDCFGPGRREVLEHEYPAPETGGLGGGSWTGRAARLLSDTSAKDGYGLMFGIGSGRLLEELLEGSELHIAAFEPDPEKVSRFREHFIRAGIYGTRVAVLEGDAVSVNLPPYIADIVVSEDLESAGWRGDPGFVDAVFHPLRPYGGAAYLPLAPAGRADFSSAYAEAAPENSELLVAGDHVLLVRPGGLPGAGEWTHQYADAANTAFSADSRVKPPLGITWFGTTPNHKVLPRHMNGPIPQVAGGRLIILGPHHISARCIYTGRELWDRNLPFVGRYFSQLDEEGRETGFPNQPGANFIGSPYASGADFIYLVYEDACLKLDASTGETLDSFEMPGREVLQQRERDPLTDEMMKSYGARLQEGRQLRWGSIRYSGDWLVAAAYPHMFDDALPGREGNWNATSSEFIVCMNRHDGAVKWVHQSRYGFRHNAIAAGPDRVFLIDNLSEEIRQMLQRRGIVPDASPRVRALELETGRVLWENDRGVFGTSLSYSAEHDVLIQSGHPGRRRPLPDEPRDRVLALRGSDGAPLWESRHRQRRAPLGMHPTRRQVMGSAGEDAVDMLTGAVYASEHPVTGKSENWSWAGALRCGTQNYSEHMVTFRSGAAGVADLSLDAGTGNIPGFRAGCTNNLVVAGGMLNAPDYTRSCSCSYQLQTSLGLTSMPGAEWWTFSRLSSPAAGEIKRAGINLGAPGSRLCEESGTLWVEYPAVGGPAPDIPVEIEAFGRGEFFRRHSSFITPGAAGRPWVSASGMKNLARLRISGLYNPAGGAACTVRLYFSDPDGLGPGERVFDVYLQGKRVEAGLDTAGGYAAGGTEIVRTYTGIRTEGALELELRPSAGSGRPPLLSGIKVFSE